MSSHLNTLCAGMRSLLVTLAACLFSTIALAQEQEQWGGDGEIEDVEIEIVRERQITLQKVSRNFEKVPPRPVEPIKPEITYTFQNLKFNSPLYNAPIRPLRLKQEPISKLYGNYLSGGFGNFSSPYLEGWFNTKRDKSRYYGAHLYHRSFGKGPVDDKNSASSNTELKLFGETFGKDVSIGGFINYENRGGYFYGYTPGLEVDRDTIRQTYDIISLGGTIRNTKPSDFNYTLGGNFSYLKDNFEAVESDLGASFHSDYKFNERSMLKIKSTYNLIARKDSLVSATPRHLFKVAPSVQFSPLERLSIGAGINLVYENDTIRSRSFHIYPDVNASYELSNSVSAFANLKGDINKVSLHTLARENFWLNSNVAIAHSNKTLEFETGLTGKLGRRLAFVAGAGAANYKNLYFHQTDSIDRAKFDVVYDNGNTQRVNVYADMNFNKDDNVKLGLRADYFSYSTDDLAEAWHRPTYRINVDASFNVYKKVLLNAGFVMQGGMKAFDPETSQVETLKEALDLKVKATYFVSKQVSLFVLGENLISSKYPVFLNYPVRGLQVMGGVSWSF